MIENPNNESKRKHIYVCPTCKTENGLQDAKVINPAELQDFVRRDSYTAFCPTNVNTEDGSEYFAYYDGSGCYLDSDDMLLSASEIMKTLELEGFDEFINTQNRHTRLSRKYFQHTQIEGKYLIPLEYLRSDKKQFNPSRKWSFKCGNCYTKVSSQDGGNYFTINPSLNWN